MIDTNFGSEYIRLKSNRNKLNYLGIENDNLIDD